METIVQEEKRLIHYVRKSRTTMVPVGKDGDMTLYAKKKIYYPRGALVCVCRGGELYFGWSYISTMDREAIIARDKDGIKIVDDEGKTKLKRPSFSKKTATKIAMDKVNSRKDAWSTADMPYDVRREFPKFLERARKYFKTHYLGNITVGAE